MLLQLSLNSDQDRSQTSTPCQKHLIQHHCVLAALPLVNRHLKSCSMTTLQRCHLLTDMIHHFIIGTNTTSTIERKSGVFTFCAKSDEKQSTFNRQSLFLCLHTSVFSHFSAIYSQFLRRQYHCPPVGLRHSSQGLNPSSYTTPSLLLGLRLPFQPFGIPTS